MVLPDDPYVVYPDPLPLDGVFDVVFWARRHGASALRRPARLVLAVLLGRLSGSP